eukprot:scaffold361_cov248-Pinguiococcus_pyrenoidosus.AAC.3
MLNDEAKEEFDGMTIDASSYDSVVLGLVPSMFCYEHLNVAFRLVKGGCPLIALHRGRYFATGPDELSLGPGAFAAALEYSAGAEAEVVGKPTRSFFELAAQQLGCAVEECYMVGDDVKDDIIESLKQAGLKGTTNEQSPASARSLNFSFLYRWLSRCAGAVLVHTGKYREGDEALLPTLPEQLCTDAADVEAAVEIILEHEAAQR